MIKLKKGDTFQVHSYKHNGNLHRIWSSSIVLQANSVFLVGANDKALVVESNGKAWVTKEPAICYFHRRNWFNVIGMMRRDGIHYYCNLSSPFLCDEGAVKYIDYDLDVKVFPNMTCKVLDEDEYELHGKQMGYPEDIDRILRNHMNRLFFWIRTRKGPFEDNFVQNCYSQYRQLKQ